MLEYDPQEAVAAISTADARMRRLMQRAGEFTLSPRKAISPFDSLLRAIVSQQLSGKAARSIYQRVRELLPRRAGDMPAAALELEDEQLRAAGLSWAKVASVKDLAAKTLEGVVPTMARLRKMDDDEITQRLVAVRGIGVWTVEMLLIFQLGRPDVLPVADLGIRKGFQLIYRTKALPEAKKIINKAEKWRPYRSVASWYLWRAVELG